MFESLLKIVIFALKEISHSILLYDDIEIFIEKQKYSNSFHVGTFVITFDIHETELFKF